MRLKIIYSCLFTCISFFSTSQNINEKLDRYFEKMAAEWQIPGMTIGIVKDGELVFSKGYGVKEIGKNEKPDENTLYAIASNSKAFTSAIIAMLVQEGKLSWDDKVKDHLPYFEVYDPYISQMVTIRDLLCHRVGLGTFSGDFIWYKSNLNSEEIIKRAKHLPKDFEFRAGFGYSNIMYITAGELIKKVTGKSWSENVKERILVPLDMNRTITSIKQLKEKENFATPHMPEGNKNIPIDWVDWQEVGATGGIISSVKDVSKWMIFNLNNGILNKDTLLTKKSRNTIWTPHNNFTVDHTAKNDFNRHFNGYGLGWGLSDYQGRLMVAHTGGYDGMITAVTLIPDEKLGVVVLTNGHKSPIRAATNYAIDAFLGIKETDWSAKLLEDADKRQKEDTRIADIKAKKVQNTKPTLPLDKCTGTYKSAIYGNIVVSNDKGKLKLAFEHTPALSATLSHWHYDTWEIVWNEKHAWFGFGTVKFNTDNNMNVTGLDFEVPNDDIFFEELKAVKVK
jgi:CubicO group peptidase (beta-lactamase class C family)